MQMLVVFYTTHHTLFAEKILKKLKIKNKVVMKPRKITTDCGLAIEFDGDFLKEAYEEINKKKLKIEGFYNKNNNEWIKIDTKL
ncbi:MAG: DUF3343 domain-containing protein [Candidatus Firestonebacteria bacterium]|nr:DUF3343 domain-containing protein [Candidatus Firestonebacteria bacterium]